jgi:hypothetical protein
MQYRSSVARCIICNGILAALHIQFNARKAIVWERIALEPSCAARASSSEYHALLNTWKNHNGKAVLHCEVDLVTHAIDSIHCRTGHLENMRRVTRDSYLA